MTVKDVVWTAPSSAGAAKRVQELWKKNGKEDWAGLEKAVREGPVFEAGMPTGKFEKLIDCQAYVNFEAPCLYYVPSNYDPAKAWPVLVVFMGGSWSMPERDIPGVRGGWRDTTQRYFNVWVDLAERHGWILVAPMAKHGWGRLGLVLTQESLAWLKKLYHVDPDRIYGWGQSMGGHASWRAALHTPDWYAAVAPVCGGYDYGAQLRVLNNVPIYQIYGETDPHSAKLNEINRKNAAGLKALGYDVVTVAKPGGHELFMEEGENILKFFSARARNLYPRKILFETADPLIVQSDQGYDWSGEFQWNPGRPIPAGRAYWVDIIEMEGKPARVEAEVTGPNVITIHAENVKSLNLYFHDRLVDLSKPVTIHLARRSSGGTGAFTTMTVTPKRSLETLLGESVGRLDPGRIYFAKETLQVPKE